MRGEYVLSLGVPKCVNIHCIHCPSVVPPRTQATAIGRFPRNTPPTLPDQLPSILVRHLSGFRSYSSAVAHSFAASTIGVGSAAPVAVLIARRYCNRDRKSVV